MAAFIDLMAFQRGAELANAANWRDVIQNIAAQTQQQNLSQKQMEFGLNLPVAEIAAKTRAGALNDLLLQQQANQALAAFEGKVLAEASRLPQAERAQYIADAARARMQEAGSSPLGQAETRAIGGWMQTLSANAWKGGAGDQRAAQIYASASPFGVALTDMRNGGRGGGAGGPNLQQGQALAAGLEAAMRDPKAPLIYVGPNGLTYNIPAMREAHGLPRDGVVPPAAGTTPPAAGATPPAAGTTPPVAPLAPGAAPPLAPLVLGATPGAQQSLIYSGAQPFNMAPPVAPVAPVAPLATTATGVAPVENYPLQWTPGASPTGTEQRTDNIFRSGIDALGALTRTQIQPFGSGGGQTRLYRGPGTTNLLDEPDFSLSSLYPNAQTGYGENPYQADIQGAIDALYRSGAVY